MNNYDELLFRKQINWRIARRITGQKGLIDGVRGRILSDHYVAFKISHGFIGHSCLEKAEIALGYMQRKRPIVVVGMYGMHHDEDVVLMRLVDLERLINERVEQIMFTKKLNGPGNAD